MDPSHNSIDAVKWWLRYKKSKKVGKFAVAVVPILEIPGHNAGTERSNNPYKEVQTALRGATGPNTLDNFVYFLANFRFIGKERMYRIYGINPNLYKKRKYIKQVDVMPVLSEDDQNDT